MSQQLVMTPQLQQAIKLLQLSHLEMAEVLQAELEQNPVLEDPADAAQDSESESESELGSELGGEAAEGESETAEAGLDDAGAAAGEVDFGSEAALAGAQLDWDGDADGRGGSDTQGSGSGGHEDGGAQSLEATAAASTSLHEHLRWQLQMASLEPEELQMALMLVEDINDDGFLADDAVATVVAALRVTADAVEAVVRLLQGFEPTGVACRSLGECFAVQAERLNLAPLVRQIIATHLPQVEKRQWAAIARSNGVGVAEVGAAVRQLARLNPRPGRAFSTRPPQYIVPDLYVDRVGNDYSISLNEEGVPRLRISSYYRQVLTTSQGQTRSYMQDKMRSAVWLLRSLQMRQRTMVRVMQSLLKFQRPFFDRGVTHLRPLVLRDVAQDIEMHESTISRVTSNKYVHTPRGVFELKYFFTSTIARVAAAPGPRLQAGSGDAGAEAGISSAAVRDSIGRLIGAEDPRRPLSDQRLVEILLSQHIDIARRTVAKYREMLRIPPSSQRRRVF